MPPHARKHLMRKTTMLSRLPLQRSIGLLTLNLLLMQLPLTSSLAQVPSQPDAPTLPLVDLAQDQHRQVVVDREANQYLGHPTTVLLEDGKTIVCVYPKGHGKGAILLKKSTDGGLTWGPRLPTPENWTTSLETPTIHRVIDPLGKKRLLLWSGLYPARTSLSDDDGMHWSDLKPAGDWGGIVVMGFVAPRRQPGHYVAMFHDDGRFISATPNSTKPATFVLYQTESTDGGVTWSPPKPLYTSQEVHLCEPGLIRSDDGKQWAVLLRENRRRMNSHLILSDDEGANWSEPRPLNGNITGDRHTGVRCRDGRWFISFRDMATSSTRGDWLAWVGTYQDLIDNRPGQYRIRLMKNHKATDCAYPGVELLPDDTIVTTTYGHWTEGEAPYIVSVRLKLSETDALLPP